MPSCEKSCLITPFLSAFCLYVFCSLQWQALQSLLERNSSTMITAGVLQHSNHRLLGADVTTYLVHNLVFMCCSKGTHWFTAKNHTLFGLNVTTWWVRNLLFMCCPKGMCRVVDTHHRLFGEDVATNWLVGAQSDLHVLCNRGTQGICVQICCCAACRCDATA